MMVAVDYLGVAGAGRGGVAGGGALQRAASLKRRG